MLGLLNSKLFHFCYTQFNPQTSKVFAEVKPSAINSLPIRIIKADDIISNQLHNSIISLVTQLLEGKKKLGEVKTDKDKEFYTRKCDALEKQIDDAVFELYGVTEEEKKLVLNS